MEDYFISIVDRLTLDDISILNMLTSKDSNTRYSARTKKEVTEESKLSSSKFRKTILRLESMNFIEVIPGNREHLLFVTAFGQEAVHSIYERSNA